MIKHNSNSYYEIILIILTLFLGIAFVQDSNSVKTFGIAFLLIAYIVKELFIFLAEKRSKELNDRLEAIKETETQKEIESIKSELNKINFKLFNR